MRPVRPAGSRRHARNRPTGPEWLDLVTASVPVSARQAATGGQLGNQVGVMPVTLPTRGDLAA
jgi:hypothetical protein